MTVWVGNYAVATDNGTAYDRQRDELEAAIQKYGTANIGGMTVGNEFILECVLLTGFRLDYSELTHNLATWTTTTPRRSTEP